jgi:hypothetical protein
MQIDLTEIRQVLSPNGGHLSFELRDGAGRLVASASLDVHPAEAFEPKIVTPDKSDQPPQDPPGPNFLSILT